MNVGQRAVKRHLVRLRHQRRHGRHRGAKVLEVVEVVALVLPDGGPDGLDVRQQGKLRKHRVGHVILHDDRGNQLAAAGNGHVVDEAVVDEGRLGDEAEEGGEHGVELGLVLGGRDEQLVDLSDGDEAVLEGLGVVVGVGVKGEVGGAEAEHGVGEEFVLLHGQLASGVHVYHEDPAKASDRDGERRT